MGKVISVSTQKGGVLKTSIVVNLAGIWATQGKKVLIPDMDAQGNVVLTFGKNPDDYDDTIYDVLMYGMAPEVAITEVYPNIFVLPSHDDMKYFDEDLKGSGVPEDSRDLLMKSRLHHLKKDYDIIIVDSPPTLTATQRNILSFVDEVIIPFQPEPYAMRSLVKMIEEIEAMKKKNNPGLNILGILPTLVAKGTNLHIESLEELAAYANKKGINVFDASIPDTIRFATEVKRAGLPATITLPKHGGSQAYFQVVKEIERIWQEIQAKR